jgi:biotin carboxyl carrier protein
MSAGVSFTGPDGVSYTSMNIEVIEQIVALINEHPVSEITVEQGGTKVHVRKSAAALAPPSGLPALETAMESIAQESEEAFLESEASLEPEPIVLTSPMVGLFHHLSPPIAYGGLVVTNQKVGNIESMKLMNEVPADRGGRVVEILIEDGAAVEYGQPLFRLTAA